MWTNKDTAQVLAVITVILSGIEKILSYLGQQYNENFWEVNPVSAKLFASTGLLYGHIILFAVTALVGVLLYVGASQAQKVTDSTQRKICMGLILCTLVGLTIFQAIVLFNNVMVIYNATVAIQ